MKRKFRPWVKTVLKISIVAILILLFLNALVDNHYKLLGTKYAPQNKKVSKTAPQLEKDTYLHYITKGV